MYVGEIALSAHKLELEPWRMDRLVTVVNYLAKTEGASLIGKIFGLHDHKGDLTATWNEPPTENEKAVLQSVWGNPDVGDGNARVEHAHETLA